MLIATVAGNFEQFHLGGSGSPSHIPLSRNDEALSASSSNSEYQQLLMTSEQDYNLQHSHSQYIIHNQATTSTNSTTLASAQHAQQAMFQPQVSTAEMTYLGQTLIPHGYPSGNFEAVNPDFDVLYRNQQMAGWQEQQRQRISPTTQSQKQFFGEYRTGLQAGSRASLSSSRASIDISAAVAAQQSQQHAQMQAAMFNQISPSQHQSPQAEFLMTTLPHHHHSMPSHSPNTINSDHGESSSRERDGGAPNMVGHEGMPEPAARPKGPKLKFTRADDALLVELKENKNLTWKQIADFFPGRSSGTLQVRYCTKLKAKTTVWTDDMVSPTPKRPSFQPPEQLAGQSASTPPGQLEAAVSLLLGRNLGSTTGSRSSHGLVKSCSRL